MIGISFDVSDENGNEWTLLRLLALLAEISAPLSWRVIEDLDFSPSPAEVRANESLRLGMESCSGLTLLSILAGDPQLIEGGLAGGSQEDPESLLIYAVDGQHWDVYSRDSMVLEILKKAMKRTIDLKRLTPNAD